MRKNDTQEKKRIIGSTFAKIVAYFLLAISFLVGAVSVAVPLFMVYEGVYDYGNSKLGVEALADDMLCQHARNDADAYYFLKWPGDFEDAAEQLENFCADKNIQIEVWKYYIGQNEEECIRSNYDGFDTPYVFEKWYTEFEEIPVKDKEGADEESNEEAVSPVQEVPANGAIRLEGANGTDSNNGVTTRMQAEVQYQIKVYVDPEFPVYDEYKVTYDRAFSIWELRYIFLMVALGCIVVFIVAFIFLMCSAGHKNGVAGVSPGVLFPIHFDILTAIFLAVAFTVLLWTVEGTRGLAYEIVVIIADIAGTFLAVWCTMYCAEAAVRFKLGQWWKHTLIYVVLSSLGRGIRFCWRTVVTIMKGLPVVLNTAIILLGVCIVEFFLMVVWGTEDFPLIWIMEKLILIPVVLYIALMCKKLQDGSKALADGNLGYQVDTSKMFLDFKEHGENLNQISQGISKAVNERMKSEHMKTELITNVSHDIKTPLTSIINYADLLGNVAKEENHLDQEKVAEYSEVLLRQSKRLKKLLEDLVEASKATTGNIEVKMEKCEVGVLLSQAVGEYENRFWEKQLELIVKQPEEPVWIMADGRRLWRVFDNLLNNVCKYAQENTRVYLTVEPRDAQVEIIFRNMSKYALDLTGEELEERFVRGDKSRHMEGNGLGLSIAKSLVELQNGTLEIVTDGDLFKVILRFPVL